jgi:hypothetical protein
MMGVFILKKSGPIFKNWHVLEFVEVIFGASKLLAVYGSENHKIIKTVFSICTSSKFYINIVCKVAKINPEKAMKIF